MEIPSSVAYDFSLHQASTRSLIAKRYPLTSVSGKCAPRVLASLIISYLIPSRILCLSSFRQSSRLDCYGSRAALHCCIGRPLWWPGRPCPFGRAVVVSRIGCGLRWTVGLLSYVVGVVSFLTNRHVEVFHGFGRRNPS